MTVLATCRRLAAVRAARALLWVAFPAAALTGAAAAGEPVFAFPERDRAERGNLEWDCTRGLRIELALEFAGYVRGARRPILSLGGIDGRGKATSVGLTFRDNGNVFFYVLPSDIDAYVICEKSRSGTADSWLQGEAHRISCGWAEDGNLQLYTDADKAHKHRPTDREYLPVKLTSIGVRTAAGAVTDCKVWLSGEGVGPRPSLLGLPMKTAPPAQIQVSTAVGIPVQSGFSIYDADVYKSAHPRVVVECPAGITPYRYAKTFRLFFGRFPYQTIKGGLKTFERDGAVYTRFVYHIPKTKVGRYARTGYPYRLQFTFGASPGLPEDVPAVYFYAEWDGGAQQPTPVRVEVVDIDPTPFRFDRLPAGLWCDAFEPDIRRYCQVQGVNYVVAQVPEADRPGGALTLREAKNRLGPGIDLDLYSTRIWWRKGLPQWPVEHAFTRIDGSVNARFPCMSYRGPGWFEDREHARRLMGKGLGGIQTDIECEVYQGCFHRETLQRFQTFLGREFPDLPHKDPREFEKTPEDFPEHHRAWVAFQGRLMSEYYLSLCQGLSAATRELGPESKPRLTIYNDTRHGRKGADLAFLFECDTPHVTVLHSPPLYQPGWIAGDWLREQVRKYPNALPAPYIGRPSQGKANMEHYVYEVFANGARGFVIYSRGWHDGRELQELGRGLRNVKKIEGLIERARILDKPFDPQDGVRIRAVGAGDEKFVVVSQHAGELGYKKLTLQPTVSFRLATAAEALVTDLRTGEVVTRIRPPGGDVVLQFTSPDVIALVVRPAE